MFILTSGTLAQWDGNLANPLFPGCKPRYFYFLADDSVAQNPHDRLPKVRKSQKRQRTGRCTPICVPRGHQPFPNALQKRRESATSTSGTRRPGSPAPDRPGPRPAGPLARHSQVTFTQRERPCRLCFPYASMVHQLDVMDHRRAGLRCPPACVWWRHRAAFPSAWSSFPFSLPHFPLLLLGS